LRSVPAQAQRHVRASLEAGVAAVGGVIEIGSRRLLVVGLDLQCCGDSADSPQEQRRRFESRAIRGAIDAVADSLNVDAVLVGGDFNTVQGDAPVTLMQRGASVPISLREADARHRGEGAADWTWDGRGTPFPSRQLDYLLHSDGLRVVQAHIFDSEDLAPEQQKALNIDPDLSRSLSEHRPVVVDFAWKMEPTP
jgi:endonuclease/exonuclease/phosphatase family metal-dependent hydrolase